MIIQAVVGVLSRMPVVGATLSECNADDDTRRDRAMT
jgi:hypothetical protein